MSKNYYGESITRAIWSDPECIVLIYVGSAADFALNPSIDWLFYTQRLPRDPQKRFIETFAYNQRIFFSSPEDMKGIAQRIRMIHTRLEKRRLEDEGVGPIPNEAFLQVSYMLVEYGIRGYEYLHNCTMSTEECERYYQDMKRIFEAMHIQNLPFDYVNFRKRRERSIREDLILNSYTQQLYDAYRKSLGPVAYWIIRQFQACFVDCIVGERLSLKSNLIFRCVYRLYPLLRPLRVFKILCWIFLKSDVNRMLKKMEA